MKIQWKQVTVALVTGLLLGAAVGAWTLSPTGRPPKGIEHLRRRLNLNPEQMTRVSQILEGKRMKVEAFRRETREEIQKILTPEQTRAFNSMEERKRRGPRPPRRDQGER